MWREQDMDLAVSFDLEGDEDDIQDIFGAALLQFQEDLETYGEGAAVIAWLMLVDHIAENLGETVQ